MSQRDDEKKKKEKKQQDWLMAQITAVLEKATKRIRKKYPKLNIVDSYSPPFGFEKNKKHS